MRNCSTPISLLGFALVLIGLLSSTAVWGQTTDATASGDEDRQPETPQFSVAEMIPVITEQKGRLTDLENLVADFPDLNAMKKKLVIIEKNLSELAERIQLLDPQRMYLNYDYVTDWQAQLLSEQKAFDRIITPINDSLEYLEESRQFWNDEKRRWSEWEAALQSEISAAGVASVFTKARQNIGRARGILNEYFGRVLALQLHAIEIKSRFYSLGASGDRIIADAPAAYTQQITPFLFSSRFFSQLNRNLIEKLYDGIRTAALPSRAFFMREKWVIIAQVLLMVVVFGVLRQNRTQLESKTAHRFLIRRSAAAGAFVGFTFFSGVYDTTPPMWDLILWTIVGFSAAALMGGVKEQPWKGRLFYGLAVLVFITMLARLVALPIPLFRLYLVIAMSVGAAWCVWLSSRCARSENTKAATWLLRFGAGIFAGLVIVEVLGLSYLTLYVFESGVMSLYTLLLTYILFISVPLFLNLFFQGTPIQRLSFFRHNREMIVNRLAPVILIGIVIFQIGYLIYAWQLYGKPMFAVHAFLSLGFSVGNLRITMGLVLVALACIYGAILFSLAVQAILMTQVFPRREIKHGVQISIARILHYFIVFSGFILALLALGVDLTNITIIGGALGIGIGFGLQSIVNNFVSGLILLFEQSVKVGDYVTIAGQWAEIKSLGLRATIVQTFDKSEIVVPNSELITHPVTNWTLSDRLMRIIIPVGVAYGSNVAVVLKTLMDCAMANAKVSRSPEPQVLFMKFGDSALEFELRVWIHDIDDMLVVQSELHQDLENRFREVGITIAFPQRDLHIRSGDPRLLTRNSSG